MLWTGKRKKLLRLLTLTTAHNAAVNPNLGRGGGSILPLCWLSLDKSETVKAVNLAFGSIQQLFIRYIRAKVGISNLPQSPVIGQNSDGSISDFRISGQFLIKENLHNSGTSNDIDMKLGPVTKLGKKNKKTSKILTMTPCHKIVASLPSFQFVANLRQSRSQIPDALSVKLTVSLKVTFYYTKTKQN